MTWFMVEAVGIILAAFFFALWDKIFSGNENSFAKFRDCIILPVS